MKISILFGTIFAVLSIIGFITIGIILYKMDGNSKPKKNPILLLIDLIMYIVKTEGLSGPGKVNIIGSILSVIASLVLAFPIIFSLIYKAIFGTELFSIEETKYLIMGIFGCCIPISIAEALILRKVNVKNE